MIKFASTNLHNDLIVAMQSNRTISVYIHMKQAIVEFQPVMIIQCNLCTF